MMNYEKQKQWKAYVEQRDEKLHMDVNNVIRFIFTHDQRDCNTLEATIQTVDKDLYTTIRKYRPFFEQLCDFYRRNPLKFIRVYYPTILQGPYPEDYDFTE